MRFNVCLNGYSMSLTYLHTLTHPDCKILLWWTFNIRFGMAMDKLIKYISFPEDKWNYVRRICVYISIRRNAGSLMLPLNTLLSTSKPRTTATRGQLCGEQWSIYKLILLVKMMLLPVSSRVWIHNQLSKEFTIEQGLRLWYFASRW